jgi:enoyl-[acyl-carrier protein] reductase/trans-2-enoyl-CoA reductase (NAD+)
MEKKGLQEDCIEQMYRLMTDRLYAGGSVPTDAEGRIRLDDWEMREDVQKEVLEIWRKIDQNTVGEYADFEKYRRDFLHLHGFGYDSIDYDKDVEV